MQEHISSDFHQDLNIFQSLQRASQIWSQKVALEAPLHCPELKLTYAQAAERCSALAASLAERFVPGDRIA